MATQIEREIMFGVSGKEVVQSGILGGLIGGFLMALVAMVRSAAMGGAFFGPVELIAATVFGSAAVGGGAEVVLVGLLLHLAVSVVLGIIFASVVRARPTFGGAVFAGLVFGALVYLVMAWLVLPTVNPVMYAAMKPMMSWFFLYHLVFGVGLGLAPSIARSLHARHVRHDRPISAH